MPAAAVATGKRERRYKATFRVLPLATHVHGETSQATLEDIMPKRKQRDACAMECTDDGIFIVFNGVRIAKRGHPNSPQVKTWVSLEPGWTVLDEPDLGTIAIVHDGVRVH